MILDAKNKIYRLIARRSFAYNMVFNKDNKYTNAVLKDLAKFCRAHETTFNADPRKHALLEGRRETYLRIIEYLKLSPDEIYELHKVKELTGVNNGTPS